ncbi:MAG: ECF transporter S component [Clostridioides sp.]|nr:ECF transporter S component [Clostridioides sp.]
MHRGTKISLRKMTVIGLLSAISIMLSMTPLGYIPLGPVNATIMHLPVIIGAVIEGPIVGMAIGFIFGVTSLIRAITTPTITSFLFMNPLVSVLPRVIMGLLSYYVFAFVMKISKKVSASAFITGVVGSMINTVGVLGMIYFIYADRYMEIIGKTGSAVKAIAALALANGIPEALVAAVVVSSVAVVIKRKI